MMLATVLALITWSAVNGVVSYALWRRIRKVRRVAAIHQISTTPWRSGSSIRLNFDVPGTLKFAAGPRTFTALGKSSVELRWNGHDWEEVP